MTTAPDYGDLIERLEETRALPINPDRPKHAYPVRTHNH